MTNKNEITSCLVKQMEIIKKVMDSIGVQDRFLHTPHMKGLNRVIAEQAVMIEEYMAISDNLNENTDWKNDGELKRLWQSVDEQYKVMVEACRRMLQEAIEKRKGIASEIGRTKQQRHMKTKYVRQWQLASVRPRFNVTG